MVAPIEVVVPAVVTNSVEICVAGELLVWGVDEGEVVFFPWFEVFLAECRSMVVISMFEFKG